MAIVVIDEDDLRRIMQEELSVVLRNLRPEPQAGREDLPDTLTVNDIAEIMRCSRAKVYDIMRRPDFPKVVDGRRIFVNRDGFFEWYKRQSSDRVDRLDG